MCKAFEETRREGAYKHAIETAKRLIARGKLTLEEIAEDTDLPLETVRCKWPHSAASRVVIPGQTGP